MGTSIVSPGAFCSNQGDESNISVSDAIDHKLIREQALYMAELLHEEYRGSSDNNFMLFYRQFIDRNGMPGPHVKNLSRWFYRVLLRCKRQDADMAAHRDKKIGQNGMRIVSDVVLNSRKLQLQTQRKNIDDQEVIYIDNTGKEICIAFSEIWNSPEKRAAKHYVRAKGLEKYCQKVGLAGFFLTLTLPPKYHPNPAIGRKSWQGFTPKDGHQEMQKRWRTFQRRFGKTIGIRVEEQHSDGCIHWHALVWIESTLIKKLYEKLERYFGGAPATIILPLDPTKGSAASYIMKYILKATGAQHDGVDQNTRDTADRADAHRATWGGRAVEIFDFSGSSTIWNEIRRIKTGSKQYAQLSNNGIELHTSAQENNYCKFLTILKQMNMGKEKKCRILYKKTENGAIVIDGLIEEDTPIITHEKVWTLRNKKK